MKDVRDHLSESISRDRLLLEARRGFKPLLVILTGIAIALLCAGWVVTNVSRTALSKTRTVDFNVADATSIVAGRDDVRFKGIPAGTITKVRVDGDHAVVTAKIQKKWGPIYRDAEAQVRPVTPLEDIYLDVVDRGTKAAGTASVDEPVAVSRTTTPVDVADVLNTFQADVRTRMRTLLDNLGNGLTDRGDNLRTAFVAAMPLVQAAGEATHELAIRKRLTRELVTNSGVLTTELARRDDELQKLVQAGAATFGTLQDRRGDLDATLRALPPTLVSLDSSLQAVDGVLPDVNDAARGLTSTADALPGALGALKDLSRDAVPALAALRPAVHDLVPLSDSLAPAAADLNRAVSTLRPQLPALTRTVKDLAACQTGVTNFFQLDPAFGTISDARGPFLRADVVEGAASASGLANDPRYFYNDACTPGPVVAGRPADSGDMH